MADQEQPKVDGSWPADPEPQKQEEPKKAFSQMLGEGALSQMQDLNQLNEHNSFWRRYCCCCPCYMFEDTEQTYIHYY
jgi:hypothetical protein